ncbi:uncharacterized protein [Amphiura filiformis]|uniref:uncharacterized protein n=1 Tax=Amphiura filiformis TaxID=82378 RepID=UPI003B227FF7
MADVYKSLDDIILEGNFGTSGNRGRGRGRGNRRGSGMRGGGGRIVAQGGVQQGARGGMKGARGGMRGARGGMRGARGGMLSRGGMQGGRGGGFRKGRGGFRGGRGGGGNTIIKQNPQNVAMPSGTQVNQSLARQATFRPQQSISVQLPDARDKLNMKARQTDARLKLNKKAQQTDARVKLNAKRRFSGEGVTNVGPKQKQQQQQQPGQQGQISRNMGNLGLTQVTIRNPGAQAQHIQPAPTQITIKNPQASRPQQQHQQQGFKKNKGGNVISLTKKTGNTVGIGQGGGLKITTVNQSATLKRRAAPVPVKSEPLEDYVLPAKVKREMMARVTPPTSGIARIKPPPVLPPAAPRISALDRVSAPRPRISTPPAVQGTRIIISNLHPVVTEEDIKELFGAIGNLTRARLVRPGLAEVIYIKREQALQAITTYHDRELDGQPMQCKLDTSTVPEAVQQVQQQAKPKTGMITAATVAAASAATQKPSSLSDRFKLYSRSNVELPTSGMRSDSLPQSSSIDPSVIHKALFKTGVQTNPTKPVLFTVKI